MPRRCGLGCTPTRGVLHVFPNPDKFPEQFQAWVRVVCGQEECNFNYRNMRICDRHFTEKDRNRYNRLNALAVPSLFLREQQSNTCGLSNSTSEQTFNQPEVTYNYHQSSSSMFDPKNEKNTLSNLAAYWTSASEEVQHDDQSGSNHPALSDAADDAGSSDDVNIPEPPPPPQLNLHTAQMCRVCLALDVKMFALRDTELKEMFQFTTGITFEEKEGSKFGSLICWECAARLQAATTFTSKALFSDSLLQGLMKKGGQIQNEYFETLKEEADSLIPPKTLTVTEIVHIVEIEDQNNRTQLVQSGDGDDPGLNLSENEETEEIIMNEIKEQILEDKSEMDVEGDKDVTIETRIEDDPTCSYGEEQNRTKIPKLYPLESTSSFVDTINSASRPQLHTRHTSLRSDLASSQEDFDDQIRKTCIETFKKLKKVPKQIIVLKRSKVALSHDHVYYMKGDSEDRYEKKKKKTF